jgi:hypothetical protein
MIILVRHYNKYIRYEGCWISLKTGRETLTWNIRDFAITSPPASGGSDPWVGLSPSIQSNPCFKCFVCDQCHRPFMLPLRPIAWGYDHLKGWLPAASHHVTAISAGSVGCGIGAGSSSWKSSCNHTSNIISSLSWPEGHCIRPVKGFRGGSPIGRQMYVSMYDRVLSQDHISL